MYTLLSAGALVSALIVANRSLVDVRHTIIGAVAFGGSMLVLAVVPNVATALPASLLVGLTSIIYTATTAIVQGEGDPSMHGRILALQTIGMAGTAPIGGPFLGWVADAFGARVPVVIGGVGSLMSGGYGIVALLRHPPCADGLHSRSVVGRTGTRQLGVDASEAISVSAGRRW